MASQPGAGLAVAVFLQEEAWDDWRQKGWWARSWDDADGEWSEQQSEQ